MQNNTLEVSTEDTANLKHSYNNLNPSQKQKYDYLYPIYNDEAKTAELASLIEGRGKNAWNSVHEKILELDLAKFGTQQYHDALYDNFDIGKTNNSSDITGVVAEVRRDLGLPPYLTRLKMNCERDFCSLFIVHNVYMEVEVNGQMKKTHIGYKPVFKLKPEH